MAAASFSVDRNFRAGKGILGIDNSLIYSNGKNGFFGGNGLGYPSSSLSVDKSCLVVDRDRNEFARGSGCRRWEDTVEMKAMEALKSHSEAERRRRERINRNLMAFRNVIPCSNKMDKASLLGEVIKNLKDLKKKASEESNGYVVPDDFDAVDVSSNVDGEDTRKLYIKATICCDDRLDVWIDLKQSLQKLSLEIVKAEMSTLGQRMKIVIVLTPGEKVDEEKKQIYMKLVHRALNALKEKAASSDFSPRISIANNQQSTSFFDSSLYMY